MAEGSNSIVLKLALDTGLAAEKATGLVRLIENFNDGLAATGQKMENTLSGRLVKGVVGTFRDNFTMLMNEDVPKIIRDAKLKIELAGAIAGAVSPQAGEYAKMLATEGVRDKLSGIQTTTDIIGVLTAGGRVRLSDADMSEMVTRTANGVAASRETYRAMQDRVMEFYPKNLRPSAVDAPEAAGRAIANIGGAIVPTGLWDKLEDIWGNIFGHKQTGHGRGLP